jgi:hypothetical protein
VQHAGRAEAPHGSLELLHSYAYSTALNAEGKWYIFNNRNGITKRDEPLYDDDHAAQKRADELNDQVHERFLHGK